MGFRACCDKGNVLSVMNVALFQHWQVNTAAFSVFAVSYTSGMFCVHVETNTEKNSVVYAENH